jgi:pimeloyl-ACP methyl ester carboxylesterase
VSAVLRRALSLLLAASLAACGLIALREDSAAYDFSTVLVGRVSGAVAPGGPVVVAAYARHGERIEIAHRALLHEAGAYELVVPKGEFSLFAFADANGNLRYDAGEPAGDYAGGQPVAAAGDGLVYFLDIVLRAEPSTRVSAGTSFAPPAGELRDTQAGALARLDDPAFAPETASKGYWAPLQFMREMGANVHFLEPYDAAKTPVLFVHGASGTPRDLRSLAEGLDRARYQPWFYYYPSGASMDSTAHLLLWKLHHLQSRYGFRRLHVVAHSIGGLVVRRAFVEHGAQFPHVKLFVSVSTPWGGEPLAAFGVQGLPASVPAWQDLQPSSTFMRSLFDRKLPPNAEHYLLFGHRGGGAFFRPNNDGAVTLASQLAPAAQAEARMVYGYNEDHLSILRSAQVRAQLNALLAAADAARASEGTVRVEFRYAGSAGGPHAQPLLVLTPSDARAARITMPLNPEEPGREIGPFPAGAYDASLLAYAYRSEPRTIPLRVGEGRSTTLGFRLLPQGVLAGYVARPAEGNIAVESITLTGAGVRRSLAPAKGVDALASYLDGADHAEGPYFSFVGLAEGTYELTIRAAGYRPHVERYRVVPGQYGYLKPIALTPLP